MSECLGGLLLADADSSFSLPLSQLKAPRRHFLGPPPASRELFVAANCSVGAGLLGVGGCKCSAQLGANPCQASLPNDAESASGGSFRSGEMENKHSDQSESACQGG